MKTAWALGAAFVALVLVLLLFGVLATEMGSAERLSSTEAFAGIDVPAIGTVGDFPDPAHRVVVNVTADGTIVVDGATYTMAELVGELKRRGGLVRGEMLVGTSPPKYLSDLRAVLRIDGSLPWGSAQRFVEACSEALVWRISFAVRHDGERADGALGFPLPKDTGCGDPEDRAWKEIDAVPNARGGSPAALCAALAESPASLTGKLAVQLRVDPALPTHVALELMDAAIRSGAVNVTWWFAGPEAPTERIFGGFDEEVRKLRTGAVAYALRLDGKPLAGSTVALPVVARVRGETSVPSLSIKLDTR